MQQGFTIKGRIPDLNSYIKAERSSRYAGAQIKKTWTDIIKMTAKAKKLKSMKLPVSVYITFYVKNKKRDKGNLLINEKWIMDGLVNAKVIANDGWDAIEGIYFGWFIGKEEMIHIMLEDDN